MMTYTYMDLERRKFGIESSGMFAEIASDIARCWTLGGGKHLVNEEYEKQS